MTPTDELTQQDSSEEELPHMSIVFNGCLHIEASKIMQGFGGEYKTLYFGKDMKINRIRIYDCGYQRGIITDWRESYQNYINFQRQRECMNELLTPIFTKKINDMKIFFVIFTFIFLKNKPQTKLKIHT